MTRPHLGATLLASSTPHRFAYVVGVVMGMVGLMSSEAARASELRGTHLDEQSMSLIAYDSIKKDGDIATASTLLFFAVANNSYMDEGVDYVTMLAQYNCAKPGTWRGNHMQAFQIGQGVIAQDDEPTEWEVADEGSVGYKNWEGVCKGLNAETIYPKSGNSLDGVAVGYRAYLKARRIAA